MTERAPNVAARVGESASATPSAHRSSAIVPKAGKKRGGVIARLKALGDRGGEALGDRYAKFAGWFLSGVEQLEDANAERRYRRRLAAAKSSSAAATKAIARPKTPLPPAP